MQQGGQGGGSTCSRPYLEPSSFKGGTRGQAKRVWRGPKAAPLRERQDRPHTRPCKTRLALRPARAQSRAAGLPRGVSSCTLALLSSSR